MSYHVTLSKPARKYFDRLDATTAKRIGTAMRGLATDPRPRDHSALHGEWEGYFRIRVGDYRIIYSIDDGIKIVSIFRIGPRGDVY